MKHEEFDAVGKVGLSRSALLARLREGRRWDLVVIGGGATGLGCAVDAAARGHSVLLLEGQDFAKGTSSRATKLIHGGVRYLAQGNLPLVREALLERSRLLANAPKLVRPMRFVVPAYRWLEKIRFGAGLTFYDLLAGSRGIRPCRFLSRADVFAALPTIHRHGLKGGVAYWDAQFDDARLAIALMRTIFEQGGTALNYCPVHRLLRENGRVVGVAARDAESGEEFSISARTVINATGVWVDDVRRLENPEAPALLRPSQGVHVVVDQSLLPGDDALLVPETPDGRVLFLVPWQGKVVIGTTDTPRDDLPSEPLPKSGEVDLILQTASRYLVRPLRRSDVRSVFVGLRPLIDEKGQAKSGTLSREHLIETSAGGMVTVTGGKWTTYRRMAEDAVDAAEAAACLPPKPCVTYELPLCGAGASAHERDDASAHDRGVRVHEALDLTDVDVRHAVRHELARTVEDVLARRHRVLFLDAVLAAAAAPAVAALLAEELGHDAAWCRRELAEFSALARQYEQGGDTPGG